jgi:hypothetical protein
MPGVITVACSIPNGLVLRVFDKVEKQEPVLGGGIRKTTEAVARPQMVLIHGPGRAIGEDPKAPISNGYALTHNVDADFFAEWMKQNAQHEAVKNQLIFASDKPDTVSGMSAERAKIKSGLQPIEPDNDARIPRGVTKADRKVA